MGCKQIRESCLLFESNGLIGNRTVKWRLLFSSTPMAVGKGGGQYPEELREEGGEGMGGQGGRES